MIINLAPLIDHTLLRPDATIGQITQLCQEAKIYGFASVCVLPYFVPMAARLLKGSTVKVGTVVGFPLGAEMASTKLQAATEALETGAEEIDMVINLAALKSQDYHTVESEVVALQALIQRSGAQLKVIIETCLLNQSEKIWACELVKKSQAAFIKTSTGFSSAGATIADVLLMRSLLGTATAIKASGGIKDATFAQQLVAAGASRLGTSNGVAIIRQASDANQESNY